LEYAVANRFNDFTRTALGVDMEMNCEEPVAFEDRLEREAELQATMTQLERFCSHVAHDLRDALSGIVGLAEMGRAALDQRTDCEAALRTLQLIGQQAHRSIEILHGLLRLAKARSAELRIGRVDLQAMAGQIAQEVAACQGAPGMPLVRVLPLPAVAADADLLHTVLFNLISNAVKFTRDRREACIEIDATTSEFMVAVCVRDNGVGFDAASAELLFKPFSRLHGTKYEGCGMGLNIVSHAVERLGGRVWAEAMPEQGARFFFTVPLAGC
jgi:signal transduction histidine kinase